MERARIFSSRKASPFARRDTGKMRLSPRSGLLGATAVFLPDDTTPSYQDDDDFEDSRSASRSRSPPRSPSGDTWEDSSRGYGQGYAYDPLNFDGESAADLNERLRPTGLEMHRLKLKPDEAFGSVFRFEGVISDTQPVHKLAWVKVATEMNLTMPDDDDVRMAMGMPAEKAIQRVMCWTQDWGETKRIAFRKAELFYETFQEYNHSIAPSTHAWLLRLNASSIPVCLCSEMDRGSVEAVLKKAGVEGLYTELIAAEDDCDTRAQMYLGAAAKLMRPPQKCVIFDSDPEGISAARDISAQVVAVLGSYAAWELQSADMTIRAMDELTIFNIRRLFSEVGEGNAPDAEPEMELETQTAKRRRGPWGGSSYDDDGDGSYVRVHR